jgi:hypothetical protein
MPEKCHRPHARVVTGSRDHLTGAGGVPKREEHDVRGGRFHAKSIFPGVGCVCTVNRNYVPPPAGIGRDGWH